ncbi:MAG: SulP family inorganic anion transporter [Snowella sp.]|nr:SulP family inorganic anion transporter [Snowella sp.]
MSVKWFNSQTLLPNLLSGIISGIINLIYSVSFAALIFPGTLSNYIPLGLSCALISAIFTTSITAVKSSFPFNISGPDSNGAVILALMAASISQFLIAKEATDAIFPTLVWAIILSTFLTGLWLFMLGKLRLGRFIRFIPYPVVGGFLAGIGWLFIQGSLKVMTGIPFDFEQLDKFLRDDFMLFWVPGVVLGITIQVLLSRYSQFWLMPSILFGATLLFYGVLFISHMSLEQARTEGFLFASFPSNPLPKIEIFSPFAKVDFEALIQQIPSLMTLFAVVPITILLNSTGLELAMEKEVDLDKELIVAGMANLVTGGLVGMVGHLSISRTLLNYKAGGRNRLSGLVASVCALFFFFLGSSSLQFLPKFVFGGLLFYLGLALLFEWVYLGWFKLSSLDYILVITILVIVANLGFLQGVGVGLMIACFLFVITYSNLQVIKNTLSGLTYQSNFERSFHQKKLLKQQGEQIYILRLQSYLFFGTANNLLETVRQRLSDVTLPKIKFLVIDFKLIEGIDSSAVISFVKIKQLTQKFSVNLILSDLLPSISEQFKLYKIIDVLEEETIGCYEFPDLDRGVEWCENQVLQNVMFRRRRFVPLLIQLEEIFPLPQQVSQFLDYLEILKIEAGYYLFHQGEMPNAIYLIDSGQVSLIRESENGQSERLGTLGEGTVIGEIGFYGHFSHECSAISDRPTRLYRLSQEVLQKMEAENPKLAAACHQFIAQLLAERIVQLRLRSENLLQ